MTKSIPLNHGKVAIVDDDMFEFLSQWKWYAHRDWNTWYVQRCIGKATIKMHRVIMNAPDGMKVDHRNHNGLDNQRLNLRVCTHAQNVMNSKPSRVNTTGFKGVSIHHGKYRAQIEVSKKKITLGYYVNPVDAARAYDQAAKKHFGEYAWTNF